MKWFASGAGIAQAGPFPSQRSAYEAMRLTARAQEQQRRDHGTCSPFPHDLVVWPEAKR
jgi:hypothetical protein